ncbi:hypothetical protein MKW92_019778, partial [Papaver armeniacum]
MKSIVSHRPHFKRRQRKEEPRFNSLNQGCLSAVECIRTEDGSSWKSARIHE